MPTTGHGLPECDDRVEVREVLDRVARGGVFLEFLFIWLPRVLAYTQEPHSPELPRLG
jgi:hypothetical protein